MKLRRRCLALVDKKAPELRFKGFTEDWEQRKFSNLVNRQSQTTDSTQLPSIEFEDIISGEGRLNKDISNKIDNRKGIYFELDYILYGKLRPYLKNWLFSDFIGKAIGDFWVFKANDCYPLFIYYLIQSQSFQQVANDTSGTKMPRSDWNLVSNTYFAVPIISEQTIIANFIKKLDDTIALHQRKLDQLKDLKQAYLQQLFPSDGEYAPKVRFSNFNLNWEQRKLGEIAPLRGGFAFKSSEFQEEGIPIVRISNILATGEVGGDFIYYPEQVKDDNYLLPDRSAVLAMSGATTGKVSILSNPNDGKVYQNQRVGYFTKTEIADYGFISTITRSQMFIEQLGAMLVAGAQPNISSKDIDMMNFTVPTNLEEQTKIGVFFEEFDHLITLHQQKLSKLERLKSAYLKKMFI